MIIVTTLIDAQEHDAQNITALYIYIYILINIIYLSFRLDYLTIHSISHKFFIQLQDHKNDSHRHIRDRFALLKLKTLLSYFNLYHTSQNISVKLSYNLKILKLIEVSSVH